MAFYGKKFKKTKFENLDELFEALKSPEKVRLMLKNVDILTYFTKNADGSVQATVVKTDGQEVFSHKLVPNVDTEFDTPDGIKAKSFTVVKDDKIESVITFPNGDKFHMDRVFEGNNMKLVLSKEGVDIKAVITHVAI